VTIQTRTPLLSLLLLNELAGCFACLACVAVLDWALPVRMFSSTQEEVILALEGTKYGKLREQFAHYQVKAL
jgi:hypothetical protein